MSPDASRYWFTYLAKLSYRWTIHILAVRKATVAVWLTELMWVIQLATSKFCLPSSIASNATCCPSFRVGIGWLGNVCHDVSWRVNVCHDVECDETATSTEARRRLRSDYSLGQVQGRQVQCYKQTGVSCNDKGSCLTFFHFLPLNESDKIQPYNRLFYDYTNAVDKLLNDNILVPTCRLRI